MSKSSRDGNAIDREALEAMLSECRSKMDSCPEEAIGLAEKVLSVVKDGKATDLHGKGLVYLSRAKANTEGTAKSRRFAEQAVEVLSGPENRELYAMALNNLGNCNRRNFDLVDALEYYGNARSIYSEMDNVRGLALIHNGMAQTYRLMGLNEMAYDSFKLSGELASSVDFHLMRAIALSNLAEMLLEQRDYYTAEKYLKEGLSLNSKLDRKLGIGFCLGALGRLEQQRNNLNMAEEYYRKAVSIWKDVGSHQHMVSSFCSLAELLELKGDVQSAGELLEKAVEDAQSTEMTEVIWIAKGRLAAHNIRAGRTENAEEILFKVIEVLEDSGEQGQEKAKACKVLANYYEGIDRFQDALNIYRKGAMIEKAIIDHEMEHDIVRLKMKDEFRRSEDQRRELEIQRIQLEKTNHALKEALSNIRTLKQLLPICAKCKKVRNDDGYWEQIEAYITEHSDTVFSHGICPECSTKMCRELENFDLDSPSAAR